MSKLPVREVKRPFSPRTEAILDIIQKMFPILVSLATAIWVVNGYFDAKDKDRQQADRELQQRGDTQKVRIREARKPFDEKQLALYFEAAKVAGILATSNPTGDDWRPAKTRFYALYWSELSMVEDRQVEGAMVKLERSLRNYATDSGRHQQVRDQVYCLAHALKASIEKTWTIDFKDGLPESKSEERGRKNCEQDVQLLPAATSIDRN